MHARKHKQAHYSYIHTTRHTHIAQIHTHTHANICKHITVTYTQPNTHITHTCMPTHAHITHTHARTHANTYTSCTHIPRCARCPARCSALCSCPSSLWCFVLQTVCVCATKGITLVICLITLYCRLCACMKNTWVLHFSVPVIALQTVHVKPMSLCQFYFMLSQTQGVTHTRTHTCCAGSWQGNTHTHLDEVDKLVALVLD